MLNEAAIKKRLIDILKTFEQQGKGMYINNNSGTRFYEKNGRKYRIKFGRRGSSDIIWIGKDKIIFIELKTEKGKLSEDQKEFGARVEELGHPYIIIRGSDWNAKDIEKMLLRNKKLDNKDAGGYSLTE